MTPWAMLQYVDIVEPVGDAFTDWEAYTSAWENQAAKLMPVEYQEEYKKLDDGLKEARRKIQELQGQKSADQKFIMSADQIVELKKLRDQEFDTQKKLKEVRKDLRKDVEREGMKHKVINIAGIPLLAAIFGIVYGVRRRSMSSK